MSSHCEIRHQSTSFSIHQSSQTSSNGNLKTQKPIHIFYAFFPLFEHHLSAWNLPHQMSCPKSSGCPWAMVVHNLSCKMHSFLHNLGEASCNVCKTNEQGEVLSFTGKLLSKSKSFISYSKIFTTARRHWQSTAKANDVYSCKPHNFDQNSDFFLAFK